MKKGKVKSVDWKVSADGSKIVFEVQGGKELFEMDAERFGLLMNGDYVRGELSAAAQEKLYPQEWGLKEFVGVQRLLQKCLNLAQIAGLWNVPEQSLRTFYGVSIQKFQHAQDRVRQEQNRQSSSETEKDYCQSLKHAEHGGQDMGPAQVFLEIPRMAAILKEQGPGGAAVKMELDFADLQAWIERNKRYLVLFGWTENLF
jgi:hypothetical protein